MAERASTGAAPSVVAIAVARGAQVLACVCLFASAAAALIAPWPSAPSSSGSVAAAALLAMAALLIAGGRLPRFWMGAAYVALGVVAVLSTVAATASRGGGGDDYFLTVTVVAVILVGATQRRAVSALVWVAVALIVAEVARAIALAVHDMPVGFDPVPLATALLAGAVLIGSARSKRASRSMRRSLQAAAREDEMSHVRRSMELQATAFMHDTVLGHLAAISAAEPGVLTEHARTQISRDIALLQGRHWLVDADEQDPAVGSWEGSPVHAAIVDVHTPDFEITISGDLGAVEHVTQEQEHALALATKQSLVNVREHAGTGFAEVVLLAARDAVTVMVIDDGVGFDPDAMPSDRLGVSHSIRRRIELVGGTVAIWSAPGSGTSVVMSVPVDREAEA